MRDLLSRRLPIVFIMLLAYSTIGYSQSCPVVKKVLINACGSGFEEGFNEYVLFNTGPTGLNIDSLQICFPNGGCYCNTSCGSQTFVSNPTYINDLNSAAGCSPPLFVDALSNNPLPPNALLVVFTGNPPTYTYNFSANCGQGPIYVLFANNTTDGTGRFVNSKNCSSSRYRTITFYFNSACLDTITWDRCNVLNVDGEVLLIDSNGSIIYGNTDGCTVLPFDQAIILRAYKSETGYVLKWIVSDSIKEITEQRVLVQRINTPKVHQEIIVPPTIAEYNISADYLPAAVHIEITKADGRKLSSNYVYLPLYPAQNMVVSISPFPQILFSREEFVRLEIISSDGKIIYYGGPMDIPTANSILKSTFMKLHDGLYILRINGSIVVRIPKL